MNEQRAASMPKLHAHLLLNAINVLMFFVVIIVAMMWVADDAIWRSLSGAVMVGVMMIPGIRDRNELYSLNLGSQFLRTQVRLAATGIVIAVAIGMGLAWQFASVGQWWVLAVVGAFYVFVLLFPGKIAEVGDRTLGERAMNAKNSEEFSGEAGQDGRGLLGFPMTPLGQVVWRPQVYGWLIVWALYLIGIGVLWVLSLWWNAWDALSVLFAITSAQGIVLVGSSTTNSLRNFLALGGSRRTWAVHTMLIGLINVVLTTILCVIAAWFGADDGLLVFLMVVGFLVPALNALFSVATMRTVWAPIVFVAVLFGAVYLRTQGHIDDYELLGVAIGLYVVTAISMHFLVRVANPWNDNLESFFGLRKSN